MTKRRDLMCEDIFGCDHSAETPVCDDFGEIIYWTCRCGQAKLRVDPTHTETKGNTRASKKKP